MLKRGAPVALDLSSGANMAPIDLSQPSGQQRSTGNQGSRTSSPSVNCTAPSTNGTGNGTTSSHLANGTANTDSIPGERTREGPLKEVICLSDDDEDEIERLARKAIASEDEDAADPELVVERKRMLRKLRNSLRAEETKLYLLKRMRISQRPLRDPMAAVGTTAAGLTANVNAARGNSSGQSSAANRSGQSGQGFQGSQHAGSSQGQSRSSGGLLQTTHHHSGSSVNLSGKTSSTLNNSSRGITGNGSSHQRVSGTNSGLLSNSNQSNRSSATASPANMSSSQLNRNSSAGNGTSTSQSSNSSSNQQGNKSSNSSSTQPAAISLVAQQNFEQQLSMRKMQMKKQLEKQLLEMPAPKPPPPELNFIPSTATNEFVALIGLEEVVKNIQEYGALATGNKKPSSETVRYVFNPFTCVQCSTDFTPLWKRDRPGSKNVICENCIQANQKRTIEREYGEQLNQRFTKFAQQEKDLDKEFSRLAKDPGELSKFQREHLKQSMQSSSQGSSQQSGVQSSSSSGSSVLSNNALAAAYRTMVANGGGGQSQHHHHQQQQQAAVAAAAAAAAVAQQQQKHHSHHHAHHQQQQQQQQRLLQQQQLIQQQQQLMQQYRSNPGLMQAALYMQQFQQLAGASHGTNSAATASYLAMLQQLQHMWGSGMGAAGANSQSGSGVKKN